MILNKNIETERLVIRRFTSEDWMDIHEYLSHEKVVHFEPYEPFTEEESKEEAIYRSQGDEFLAICLKNSGKVIGNLYFSKRDFEAYEIGYLLNFNYWKNGYATEAAASLINYAFKELNIRRIIAECNPENIPSWKLLQRLNMRREGHLIKNISFKMDSNNEPIWQDTYLYGLLREEV